MALDKDTWIAENIFPKNSAPNERKLRQNVTAVDVTEATRKTRLTLCVMGSWAIYMPPYNLARLSALTRKAGYYTRVFDFNVESHYALKEANPELSDAWNGASYWWWQGDEYYTRIHPTYEPILRQYIDKILEEETDIIGFSTYYTNIHATEYVIKEIRKLRPTATIVMGGPQCHERNFEPTPEVDYYFIGESEQNILDFLNNWEQEIKPEKKSIGSLYSDKRIDIDSLPYPDYSDYDLSLYWGKNSICAEISRGCIAKCSYCTEVYYWKFRDRGSIHVLDELEYQVKKYGINFVSFVDSLMNGNLKEFRKLCEGLVARNLGITWWGYARCDGRMNLEFYKLMKAAGCNGFNYGIESGSDKVLKLVNKKNTVAEINQNLIDSQKVGMLVSACWVIGAPGEDIEAFSHSLNMLWNHRERIVAVSPGPGLGDNLGSDYDNRAKYNMNSRHHSFLGGWYTLDMKNTRLHRMIRIKLMHIWLHLCKNFGGTLTNVHSVGDITEHYSVDFDQNTLAQEVEYEWFNYEIIQSDFGDFANSIMNEVFGFLRILWRVKGGYEITIDFNDELDRQDFIFVVDPDKYSYTSKIRFKIDEEGNYEIFNTYKFVNSDTQVHKTVQDFEFVYETNGKWVDITKSKIQKFFYITSKVRPTELPLESCFSGMAILERKLLHNISRNLPDNGISVAIAGDMGGIASIIANANTSLNVYFADPYPNQSLTHWQDQLYQDWLSEQLEDVGRLLNYEKKESLEILDKIKEWFINDPSGISVRKKILEQRSTVHFVENYASLRNLDFLQPVNMFFISLHDKYRLHESLDFFAGKLVAGGIILVHLYNLNKDVNDAVNLFIKDGWKITQQAESLIIIERCA